MDLGLRGKVAIVTAATANIGRGIALELASEGASAEPTSVGLWRPLRKWRLWWPCLPPIAPAS